MEQSHLQALSTLAETDPEFYKYLQENDKDLLNFGQDSDAEHSHNEEVDSDDEDINAPPPQHESLKAKKAAKKKLAKDAAPADEEEEEGDDSEFEGFEGGETDEDDEGGDMMGGEDEDAKRGKKVKGKDVKNQTTVLTMEMLRGWQKGMLEVSFLSWPFLFLSNSRRGLGGSMMSVGRGQGFFGGLRRLEK